jgi:hypothetical protein
LAEYNLGQWWSHWQHAFERAVFGVSWWWQGLRQLADPNHPQNIHAIIGAFGGFAGARYDGKSLLNKPQPTLVSKPYTVSPKLQASGALRQMAKTIHNMQTHPIGKNQTTVVLAEIQLANGQRQVLAAGSSGKLSAQQKTALLAEGVQIVGGSKHGEINIRDNLPAGAIVLRWGISWAGQQKAVPCSECAPIVNALGGKIETD